MKKKLILYDIDGTLVTTGGAGVRALDRAFETLFGIGDAFKDIAMAGRTDAQIMKEGLRVHGLQDMDGNLSKMEGMYLQYLREEIENPHREIMPGIKESLDLFGGAGMSLGLLTGNLEKGAKIKLGPFGLNEYFIDGAFGSDHEDRDELLPIAIRKFADKGLDFKPRDCVIIGDTPRDVQCAKVHGAQCIAVATGPYSKDALLETEADMVLDSLLEKEAYERFVFSAL